MTSDHPSARLLEWDTAHFGMVAGRIADDAAPSHDVIGAHDALIDRGARFICFLASADRFDLIARATARGYRLVDVRLTFSMGAPQWGATHVLSGVDRTVAEDLPALVDLARVAHRNTRFRNDGRLDPDLCDDVYARWVSSSYDAGAPMWTAADDEGPTGYLVGGIEHGNGEAVGRIGLIAVNERSRGRGTGRALVQAAHNWFGAQGCTRLLVGTQGRNDAAVRLYQSAGYRLTDVSLWLHWLDDKPSPPNSGG